MGNINDWQNTVPYRQGWLEKAVAHRCCAHQGVAINISLARDYVRVQTTYSQPTYP